VRFAGAIRRATGATTVAVGLITDAEQAATILAAGDADMVAMARAFLWEPRWPWHAAVALGGAVEAPRQYFRAVPKGAAKASGELRKDQR